MLLEIISPAKNEKINLDRLLADYQKIEQKLAKEDIEITIKFVDDCSDDGTDVIFLEKIKSLYIRYKFVKNIKNKGFSKCCIDEIAVSEADYCLILPGDAEIDVDKMDFDNIQKFDVIWYSRRSLDTRPIIRIIISKIYKYVISISLFSKVRDYNGIYLIKKQLFNSLNIRSKSFFINAEVYIKFFKLDNIIKDFRYVSLRSKIEYQSQSLSLKMFFLVLSDYLRVFILERINNKIIRQKRKQR